MKSKVNINIVIKCIIALLFPAAISLGYLWLRGLTVGDLFLPASFNTDCLLYYKQVEAIVNGGAPFGFYGYHEGHALVGNLGPWSPAIYFPWVIWGKVFGWGFYSPLVCNIVLLGVALCVFTALTKPGNASFAAGLVTLALFPSLPIHLMNALSEAVVAAHFIVLLAVSIRLCEYVYPLGKMGNEACFSERKGRFIALLVVGFILGIFLTLCRPYLICFLAAPIYAFIKAWGKKAAAASGLVLIVSLVSYYLLTHFMTAEYFFPLFKTGIVKAFLKGHIFEGLRLVRDVGNDTFGGIFEFVSGAFRYGSTAGTQYVIAVFGLIFVLILALSKGQKERKSFYIIYLVSMLLICGAIVFLLQEANEGARHLWMFAISGSLMFPQVLEDDRSTDRGARSFYYGLKGLAIVLLIVFMAKGSLVPTDYDIPVGSDELKSAFAEWQADFENIRIDDADADEFDNTVIWELSDDDFENTVGSEYAPLYALPSGAGINQCYEWYILDNFDSLQSRYIYTNLGGETSALCEKDMKVVARAGNMVVYERQ